MKLKIKVKRINKNLNLPVVSSNGDWIDLRCSETHEFNTPQKVKGKSDVVFDTYLMPLGVAIELPAGFEAVVDARSSLPFSMGLQVANSQGVIDNSYKHDTDEWKAPLMAIRKTTIEENARIVQFRIQLSQKATVWQKLKWFLSSGVEIVEVEHLKAKEARGGFGSTGKV